MWYFFPDLVTYTIVLSSADDEASDDVALEGADEALADDEPDDAALDDPDDAAALPAADPTIVLAEAECVFSVEKVMFDPSHVLVIVPSWSVR
jgi:hypothetical protein